MTSSPILMYAHSTHHFFETDSGTGVARARTGTLVFGFLWWLPLARHFERGEEPSLAKTQEKRDSSLRRLRSE
jgi:hypothetical protein